MSGKVSEVVRLTDDLAVDIALEMLGRPQKLRPDEGQGTMPAEAKPLDAKFQALARLTSWVAVKNRIDDDEPEGDFFSGARAKLNRKGGGRGGRGGPAPQADGPGGEPLASATGGPSAGTAAAPDGGSLGSSLGAPPHAAPLANGDLPGQ